MGVAVTLGAMRYRDRSDAGRRLAQALIVAGYLPGRGALVLGVARGGVPVAAPVAAALDGELDVAVARKIRAPMNPEFAIGAIALGGEPMLNGRVIVDYAIPQGYVEGEVAAARREIERRTAVYRGVMRPPDMSDRLVIVVDDGVATGSTLIAVLRAVRAEAPSPLVCAVPVGPRDTIASLASEADDVVCPLQPRSFSAVGAWYRDFGQLADEDVVAELRGQRGSPA